VPAPPTSGRPVLCAYVSGHGFGHFTRSAAVLERLRHHATIHLRTSGSALALARRAPWLSSITDVDVGPGVCQRGPLEPDLAATRAALAEHLRRLPDLVEAEARWLAGVGASAVLADVPPLGLAAAHRAGVPAVGLGNFTWSWIYDGYAHHHPDFARAAAALRPLEAQADLFLALEGGGGLEHLPRVVPVAPVYRRPRLDRAAARRRLGLEAVDATVVLASFGGFGGALDLAHAAAHNPGLFLLVVGGPSGLAPGRALSVEPDADLTHPDLMAACDCVLGKPGYGTAAEALHRPTPFVHVPRGEFREQAALCAFIARYLPQAALSSADFTAGNWSAAVAEALAARPPAPPPPGDGVAEAAARLGAVLGVRPDAQ